MESRIYHPTEIDSLFAREQNLKAVIEQIEKELTVAGNVLCGIKINGMTLSPEDELNFQTAPRAQIKDLEIKIQSLTHLISESRQSLVNYFKQIKDVALKASEALRAGVITDANDMVGAIVDGTAWVTEMLSHIRLLDPGFPAVEKQWIAVESEFLRVSRELLEAFERDDLVLLADNLEYEWDNAINQWLNVLVLLDQEGHKTDNKGNES